MNLPPNYSGATTDDQLVGLWLSGRPEATQDVYRPVAVDFLRATGKGIQDTTVADVVAWTETLTGADATRFRKVSTIKSLLTYAHRTGYTTFNVGLPIKCLKPLKKLHERILDEDSIRNVVKASAEGRDRTLLQFLYASGTRIAEACGLRFCDIRGNRVTIQGKGRKTRTILLPEPVIQSLRILRWSKDTDQSFVFKSFRGNKLLPRNAREIVSAAGDEAGVALGPHHFRHAHASHALDNGAPIHLVQASLGHANVSSTSEYLHAKPSDGASRYLNFP